MRGRALLLVALATSTFAVGLPMGLSTATDTHAPIAIDGDADLAACDCVRSGSGTLVDPYVISDWYIDTVNGIAISVKNVASTHFIVKDNTLKAAVGVRLESTGDRGSVTGNAITMSRRGVEASFASPVIAGNTFLTSPGSPFTTTAIQLKASNPQVLNNIVQGVGTGLEARQSTPLVQGNSFIGNTNAMTLTETTTADVRSNVVHLASGWGIRVTASSDATVTGNTIDEGAGGVIVDRSALTMVGNTVTNQKSEAVRFSGSDVFMVDNVVSHNFAGAVGADNSRVQILNNTFENSRSDALRLNGVEGLVKGNTLRLNNVGIALLKSIVRLEENVMEDNRYGLSIPHDSRQSIPLMQGNLVNGVNVDGSLVAAERVFYYRAQLVTISGDVFDAGVGGGFSGDISVQGTLVIYDSSDMAVDNSTFFAVDVGIAIVNSERITVRDNTFIDIHVGIHAEGSFTFIKRNRCEIGIDPPATICIRVRNGFSIVANNTAIRVGIGIEWIAAKGSIEHNTVLRAGIGIRAQGTVAMDTHDTVIVENRVERNGEGIVLAAFRGLVHANVAANNTATGITMRSSTNATIEANLVTRNRIGIHDAFECTRTGGSCSGGVFVENRVTFNAGTGIRANAGGTFRGNVVHHNTAGIQVRADARFTDDVVTENDKIGIRGNGTIGLVYVEADANGGHEGIGIWVVGHARLWDVTARANTHIGIIVCGTADGLEGNFSSNGHTGMVLTGSLFVLKEIEVSLNGEVGIHMGGEVCTVPNVTVTVPTIPPVVVPNLVQQDKDPLFLSDSNLVQNGRYALLVEPAVVAEAQDNFWGPDGPRMSTVAFADGPNLVSPNAVTTWYWADREHTTRGLLVQPAPPAFSP